MKLVLSWFVALVLVASATGREYPCSVVSVYDGDTITANINLGLDVVLLNQKVRLYGIDTPEVRGEEAEQGKAVRDWLLQEIKNAKQVTLKSSGVKETKGKYGRWLFILMLDGKSVNDELVESGRAKAYYGGAR